MPRRASVADKVKIVRIEKVRGSYAGGLRVHFLLGKTQLSVCVDSEDFSERKLKRAIATEIACEFAFRQAKRLVGESFSIAEVLREYERVKDFFDILWQRSD